MKPEIGEIHVKLRKIYFVYDWRWYKTLFLSIFALYDVFTDFKAVIQYWKTGHWEFCLSQLFFILLSVCMRINFDVRRYRYNTLEQGGELPRMSNVRYIKDFPIATYATLKQKLFEEIPESDKWKFTWKRHWFPWLQLDLVAENYYTWKSGNISQQLLRPDSNKLMEVIFEAIPSTFTSLFFLLSTQTYNLAIINSAVVSICVISYTFIHNVALDVMMKNNNLSVVDTKPFFQFFFTLADLFSKALITVLFAYVLPMGWIFFAVNFGIGLLVSIYLYCKRPKIFYLIEWNSLTSITAGMYVFIFLSFYIKVVKFRIPGAQYMTLSNIGNNVRLALHVLQLLVKTMLVAFAVANIDPHMDNYLAWLFFCVGISCYMIMTLLRIYNICSLCSEKIRDSSELRHSILEDEE